MMKMVPARRFVSDASPEPPSTRPSIARSRLKAPAGKAGVECASVTATEKPSLPLSGGEDLDYQRIVKIRLGPMQDGQRHICADGMVGTPSDTHSRDPLAFAHPAHNAKN